MRNNSLIYLLRKSRFVFVGQFSVCTSRMLLCCVPKEYALAPIPEPLTAPGEMRLHCGATMSGWAGLGLGLGLVRGGSWGWGGVGVLAGWGGGTA